MPAPTNVKVTFSGDTSQLAAASKQASAAIASTGQAADKAAKQAEKAALAQQKAAEKAAAAQAKEAARAADQAAKEAAKVAAAQQRAADDAARAAQRLADEQARQAQRAAEAQARAAQDAADAQARAIREQEAQMAALGDALASIAAAADRATNRLTDIGDSADPMAKARTEADRLLKEIALLEAQTGDTAAAERARAAVLAGLDDKQHKIAAGADDMGDKMGKAGGSAAKMAGALSLVSPAAADSARNLADLADVGELASEASAALGISATAAAVSLGAVLSAVALLAAAYAGWNEEAATATRLTEQQNALTAAMAPLYNDTEAAIRGAKVELGLMTEAQAEMIEAGLSGLEQYQTATEATRKRLSELRASQASMTGQIGALVGDIGEALPFQEYNLAAQVIDALTTSTAEFDTEEGRLKEGLAAAAGEVERNRKAHEALTGAKKKGAAATKEAVEVEKAAELAAQARRDAEEKLQEVLEERRQKEEEYAAGIAALRDIEREANADRLTELQALELAYQDQIQALNESLTAQLELAGENEIKQAEVEQAGRDARLAIEQRYQRDRGEIVAEGNQRIADENEAATAALLDQQRQAAAAQQQVVGDLFGAASDLAGALMEAGINESKKGLKVLFGVQQAAAAAQALVNTGLAVSNALALPLPPPLPQIAAVAAGVAGAAQVAAIMATPPPSFRTGYMPDQQLAYIEPGSEMVVPASGVQAMGGRQAAEQAFAGVAPSGGAQTTYFTMGHRAFSALVQGSAGRPGPLRDLTIRPGAGRRLRR